MLKNWSKIVLVSMLVLMVAVPASFATTARVRSLANTGDYMSDDSNAHRWYSVLPSYANQVNAEVGTYSGYGSLMDTRALSVNYACGEDGKWGTYRLTLDENQLDDPGLWMANQFFMLHVPGAAGNLTRGLGGTVNTPMNKWDFAGGWEIGDNVSVGVSFTRSSWNLESTTPDTSMDQSFTTFGVGGTWTNNDKMTGDLSFTWGHASGTATFATNPFAGTSPYTIEFDSKNAIEIAGRFMWDWKDNVTVVPVASFSNSNYSLSDNQDPSLLADYNGDKYQVFHVGVGLNMDVNTSNMLIMAAEYTRTKWEFSNTGDPTASPGLVTEITQQERPTIRLALESSITSWMTTRIGAAKHLLKTEAKAANGDKLDWENGAVMVPSLSPSFDWSLGVGFNVSEWTIDLELADEAPFSTFYWITGYSAYIPTGPGPVSRISAIYNF